MLAFSHEYEVRSYRSEVTSNSNCTLVNRPEVKEGVRIRYNAFEDPQRYVNLMVVSSVDSWFNQTVSTNGTAIFIRQLDMTPIDITISFKTRIRAESEDDEQGSGTRKLMQFGMSLTNID